MSYLTTDKVFARRLPFAIATLSAVALALAISYLPTSQFSDFKLFCFIILQSLWFDVLKTRLSGVGISTMRWLPLLVGLLFLLPCLYFYFDFHPAGRFVAAALFLGFQVPLVAMRTRDTPLAIPVDSPKRTTQIAWLSLFFLIMIAGLVALARRPDPGPRWEIVLFIIVTCFLGQGLWELIRRGRNSDPTDSRSIESP